MSKTQSFYQSILQNSTLVVKVSGKICDNQQSIENVNRRYQRAFINNIKAKSRASFGFGRQLDHYMKNVHQIEPKKVNGRRITSQDDIEAAKKISGQILIDIFSLSSRYNIEIFLFLFLKKTLSQPKKEMLLMELILVK